MADSMTPERLAEIRERAKRCEVVPDHPGSMFSWQDSAKDVPALLAEVERLRAEQVIDRQALDRAAADEDLVGFGLALREALDAPRVTIREAIDQAAALRTKLGEAVDAIKAAQTEAGVAREKLKTEHLKRTRAEMDRDGALREAERLRAEVEQWRATFGETALRDGLARMTRVEAERDRLTEQARRVWMAAAEMHEFNSPEGDHLEGCPGCRIEAALSGTEAGQ